MARCQELEGALAELRGAYEQYFLGNERQAPLKAHQKLKKDIAQVQAMSVRQTAAKFRVDGLNQKMQTYERLWDRTLKEIEAGTYRRDLAKLRRKPQQAASAKPLTPAAAAEPDFDVDEDVDMSDLREHTPKELPAPKPLPKVGFWRNRCSAKQFILQNTSP